MNTLQEPTLLDSYTEKRRGVENANTIIGAKAIPEEQMIPDENGLMPSPLANLQPGSIEDTVEEVADVVSDIPDVPEPEQVTEEPPAPPPLLMKPSPKEQLVAPDEEPDMQPFPELQPSPLDPSVVSDETFKKETGSWFTPVMETAEFLLSPLVAFSDAALAPIANPSQADTMGGQLKENFATSWDVFKRRMFPEYGQENVSYGQQIADRYMEGAPPLLRETAGVTLDIITDPGIVLGTGFQKVIQRGLRVAHQQSKAGVATKSTIIQEGLHDILAVGGLDMLDRDLLKAGQAVKGAVGKGVLKAADVTPDALKSAGGKVRETVEKIASTPRTLREEGLKGIDPAELGDIGKLAERADGYKTLKDGTQVKISKAAQQKAIIELDKTLDKNPLIKHAIDAADEADIIARITEYEKTLGKHTDPAFTVQKVDKAEAANLKSAPYSTESYMRRPYDPNSDIAGINTNMARMNTTDEIENTIVAVAKVYEDDLKKVAGKQSHRETIRLAEQEKLSDLIGAKVTEFTPEMSLALRNMLVASGDRLTALSAKTMNPNATPLDHAAFEQAFEIHKYLQAKATGVASHGGRLLESHKIPAASSKARLQEIERLIASGRSPKDTQLIRQQLAALNDPTEINRLVQRTKVGSKWSNAAFEVYANSILSGPITHAVNIASNALNIGIAPTEKYLEALSAAARTDFAKAGLDLAEANAMTAGIVEGIGDALMLFSRSTGAAIERRTGLKTGQWGKDWTDINLTPVNKGQHEVAQMRAMKSITSEALEAQGVVGAGVDFLGSMIRIPGDLLVKEDTAFKVIHKRMHINSQAARKAAAVNGSAADKLKVKNALINNPDTHMIQQAEDMARYYTFTQELGKTGAAASKLIKNTPLRFVAPFFNTPTNIVKMGARHSILGNVVKDLKPALTQGGAAGDAARAKIAMGTLMPAAVIGSLPLEGITGSIDQSTPAGRFAAKQGHPPYSIKIGDKWISYEKLEPIRAILGMAVAVRDGINSVEQYDPQTGEENNQIADGAMAMAGAMMRVATEAYMVDQVAGVITMLRGVSSGNPEYAWKEFQRVAAAATAPNAIRQWNQVYGDGTMRSAENYIEMWKQGIPGLSKDLPPKRNVWGEEQLYPMGVGPDIISPLKSVEREYDDVDKEIIRLGDMGVSPPETVREITYEGVTIELTPEQRDKVALLRGQGFEGGPTLKQTFEEMFSDPMYQVASDMDKAAEVKKRFTQATEMAKDYLVATDWELQTKIDEAIEARERQRQRTMQ